MRVRTLMCVPLRGHAKRPVGVLQLDTRAVGAGFTTEDLDLLTAAAVPVGLAVDNAQLLERARREQRRLAILAEAGAVLTATLDVGATMLPLARLLIPDLADLCLVDMLDEEGAIHCMAAVHVDPLKQGWTRELRERYPLELDGPHPAEQALRTGQPVACEAVEDADLAGFAHDADHLALLRRLGVKSYLYLPLTARGRTLGVLSLVRTESSRHLDAADRDVASELARRTALAWDNARLYGEATAARTAAETAGRSKDLFLAMLSHELRTPLTPAQLAVSALRDEPGLPETVRDALDVIHHGIALETRLVDDLLDATRISAGKLRMMRERLDAHAAIRRTLALCDMDLKAAAVRLELALSAARYHVDADPARLEQVLWNLVKNACKFSLDGGVIALRTRNLPDRADQESETRLVIEVTDSGVGLEPHQLECIFEPFEQLRHGPGRPGGLGLGLAIARAIAEAHGGHLSATSAGPGRGSSFVLELPLTTAAVTPDMPAPPSRPATREVPSRILLVEDDEITLRSAGAPAPAPGSAGHDRRLPGPGLRGGGIRGLRCRCQRPGLARWLGSGTGPMAGFPGRSARAGTDGFRNGGGCPAMPGRRFRQPTDQAGGPGDPGSGHRTSHHRTAHPVVQEQGDVKTTRQDRGLRKSLRTSKR